MLSKEEELQMIKEQEHALRQLRYDQDEEQARRSYELALRDKIEAEVNKQSRAAGPMSYNIPNSFKVQGSGTYQTSTGNNNREHGLTVSNITTGHGYGYFSHIQIYQDDFIRYKLFRGRFFDKLWFKLTGRGPRDEDGHQVDWKNIPGQYDADLKLEVTLGKTYLKIDEEVAEDLAECEHEDFIRGIAKTDPENLKMIAGLKTLDDGMKAPLEIQHLNGATIGSPQTIITPPSIKVGKPYSTVPASESMMAIDNCDNISFSPKMAEAIKKVTEEPETELLKTGKGP